MLIEKGMTNENNYKNLSFYYEKCKDGNVFHCKNNV